MTHTTCTIKTILQQLLTYKKEVFWGNIVALISTLLIVAIPLFIPLLVDELLLDKSHGLIAFISTYIFTSDTKGYVFFILFLTIVLRVASVLFGILQSKIFTIISKKITYNMRVSLLHHLQDISLKEYEMMRVGAVTSKLVTDVETIDGFVSATISKLILSSLVLLFSAVVLLWIHWQLALFILITNPIVVYFTAKLARNIGKLKKEENRAIEVFQSSLTETLELFQQIRAANKERYFFERSREKAKRLQKHAITYGYKSDAAMKFSYLVFLSGYEVFRAVSILAVAYSDLSVGLMLAIFSYLWVMVTPTQDIINFQYALSNAQEACKRINTIYALEQEPSVVEKHPPFIGEESIDIVLKGVSFAYLKGKNVLEDIDMRFAKGQKVAIVGASGSGKTTLANILVGFHTVDSGEVYYDGILHTALSLRSIRENIHLILQHPKLFNDTMLFNLTLGKSYSVQEIQNAIDIAQLGDVIDGLASGLETMVGKDGIKLSGGQRQRVAIARMVLSNPKVVIFDESTSALDVHTEAKLFKDLDAFLAHKTVITIAHRLSTIQSAAYIYVLEGAKVVDAGTPEALLARDESYFTHMI